MNKKCIAKAVNLKGTVFALVRGEYWEVLKLCSNYDGQVRGGIRKTWRVVDQNLNESTARSLYGRRLAGTQR